MFKIVKVLLLLFIAQRLAGCVKVPGGSQVSSSHLREMLEKNNTNKTRVSSRITDLRYLYDLTEGPFVLQYTVKGSDKLRERRRWHNTWTVFMTSANWTLLRAKVGGGGTQSNSSVPKEQPASCHDDTSHVLYNVKSSAWTLSWPFMTSSGTAELLGLDRSLQSSQLKLQ